MADIKKTTKKETEVASINDIAKKTTKPKAIESKEKTAESKATPSIITTKKASSKKGSVERFYATGRRKEATARVWLSRGSGKIVVNDRDVTEYFARPVLRMIINQPFVATETTGQFDVMCTVKGSGLSGQAGAVRLGISRVLDTMVPDLHPTLRKGGFLTRDSRKVERKKFGHKKARKSFQFSKR